MFCFLGFSCFLLLMISAFSGRDTFCRLYVSGLPGKSAEGLGLRESRVPFSTVLKINRLPVPLLSFFLSLGGKTCWYFLQNWLLGSKVVPATWLLWIVPSVHPRDLKCSSFSPLCCCRFFNVSLILLWPPFGSSTAVCVCVSVEGWKLNTYFTILVFSHFFLNSSFHLVK